MIEVKGIHSRRLNPAQGNPREIAFANAWKEDNTAVHGRPNPLLMVLLSDGESEMLLPYDAQSVQVAATVIQWLGSNVGFAFLHEALGRCGYKIVDKNGKP